jgi:hypothetical protein
MLLQIEIRIPTIGNRTYCFVRSDFESRFQPFDGGDVTPEDLFAEADGSFATAINVQAGESENLLHLSSH